MISRIMKRYELILCQWIAHRLSVSKLVHTGTALRAASNKDLLARRWSTPVKMLDSLRLQFEGDAMKKEEKRMKQRQQQMLPYEGPDLTGDAPARLRLMDMEEVVVPSVTRRLRNMAVCKRLQLQTRGAFQLVEFMTEAEKTVEEITHMLSTGKLDQSWLESRADPEILQEVVQNFSKLSAVDRRELLLHKLHHDETRGLVYDISVKKSTGAPRIEVLTVFVIRHGMLRRMERMMVQSGQRFRQVMDESSQKKFRQATREATREAFHESRRSALGMLESPDLALADATLSNFRFSRSLPNFREDSWQILQMNYFNMLDHAERNVRRVFEAKAKEQKGTEEDFL